MLKMQQQHRVEQQFDEKLMNQMKEQIGKAEEEKGQAFNELREMKKVAEETNAMVNEVLNTKRGNSENYQSISMAKEQKLGVKDNKIDANVSMVSDYKRKVQELEAELDKRKESEANLYDTLVMQTKQLEQSKISLEESKFQIASLQEKLKAFQGGAGESKIGNTGLSTKETSATRKVNGDQEGEEISTKAKALLAELNKLRSELRSATEAEENSKKAMDDLAFALKEVATEANQVKAKLTLSQVELEHTKGDAERWRAMLETTEEKYKELLDVTRKEADTYKNTAERMRLEAEDSLLAWNGKETEFVNCIRRTEEERLLAQQETNRVLDLLKEAEKKTMASKEENQKLRDILKQALNEANVAKEAAEIAKAENARLQDSLTLLVQENEMLKIHEAASFENIKELKRLLSDSSIKEFKNEDAPKPPIKEANKEEKESGRRGRIYHSSVDQRENREPKNLNKTFSLNLREMISPHKQHKVGNELEVNKESNEDEDDTLRGSIFDEVDSSDSESNIDTEMGTPDESDHLDEDSEGERNSRKRRALLRRFGDLIRRKSYNNNNNNNNKKESPNVEENLQT